LFARRDGDEGKKSLMRFPPVLKVEVLLDEGVHPAPAQHLLVDGLKEMNFFIGSSREY
jgi:hypothetical protein